jgi:hypothetical protein
MYKIRMSTNSDDHTLVKQNDYQEVEVDYADPESPTHRESAKFGYVHGRRYTVHNTDDTVKTSGLQPKELRRQRQPKERGGNNNNYRTDLLKSSRYKNETGNYQSMQRSTQENLLNKIRPSSFDER